MSKLTLKNIYKVYEGGVRAVSDFNLEIKDKEFIVFVGPSGCGKSTTLRMIAGLEEITSGELFIDDELMNDVEPKDRNIAMVFQNYALYPHMSVFQNMAFGLKLRKTNVDDIERRVKNAANILGITDLLTRKPKALSGGQRQRVALGRAIVREPNVFLLDEPLSNLDAKLRVQMRTEITKLHQKLETTFIYVTHDQTEAMTMGDRIVVMKDGLIQQVDTPATLYEEPCNIFVATFLGSPQMNIFEVTLSEDKTIKASFGNNVVDFKETKSKQLIDRKYINQKVLLGIRPENIHLSNKGIKAIVDQIEHLGSETIIYSKVDGIDNNLTIKIPSNHDIKINDEITIDFDINKAHLFDPSSTLSIMGVPEYNYFDCKLENVDNNTILTIGNDKLALPEDISYKLLDYAKNECCGIRILTNKISLVDIPESFKLHCKVEFKVNGSDSDVLYTRCKNKENYFIIRVNKCNIKENDEIDVYVPFKYVCFVDLNDNRLNSKERIYPNTTKCNTITKNGKTTISIASTKLVFDDLHVNDGVHNFSLISNNVGFIYSKKYAKANKINQVKAKNTLKASAYDEDIIGSKNIVFVKINGFEHYVSLSLPNDFSVYKMPEFEIVINRDSFIID